MASSTERLKRELGIGGATMMGLGSMVGTGVFVSIGIAAGVGHRAEAHHPARHRRDAVVTALLYLAAGVAAMLGVLLNLILGLSRVVLAMGRQGDFPPLFGRLSAGGTAPGAAVIAFGILIAALAAIGSVETTWAFSAFTVLSYDAPHQPGGAAAAPRAAAVLALDRHGRACGLPVSRLLGAGRNLGHRPWAGRSPAFAVLTACASLRS